MRIGCLANTKEKHRRHQTTDPTIITETKELSASEQSECLSSASSTILCELSIQHRQCLEYRRKRVGR
jgi:hypothetical protein